MIVAPGIGNYLNSRATSAGDVPKSLCETVVTQHKQACDELIKRQGDENPYLLHRELGDVMTRNVTVVRENKAIEKTLEKIDELDQRYGHSALADRGQWTNQSLSFARALGDMLVMARVIAKGALMRDECRGAHYKPQFEIKSPDAEDPEQLRGQASAWCDAFAKRNEKWLKTTIAEFSPDGPKISYEPVDTSLIPPRPRTYGLKGAEIIEEIWRERIKQSGTASRSGDGKNPTATTSVR